MCLNFTLQDILVVNGIYMYFIGDLFRIYRSYRYQHLTFNVHYSYFIDSSKKDIKKLMSYYDNLGTLQKSFKHKKEGRPPPPGPLGLILLLN